MVATRRSCQYPGCSLGVDGAPYITQEGLSTQDSVLKDLELHITMVHAPAQAARSGGGASHAAQGADS